MGAEQVPAGVSTGLDAVRFFCSGAGQPGDLIYCNLAVPCTPEHGALNAAAAASSSRAGRQADRSTSMTAAGHASLAAAAAAAATEAPKAAGGGHAPPASTSALLDYFGQAYNPYELLAVPQSGANKHQHWVVSYYGVTLMR